MDTSGHDDERMQNLLGPRRPETLEIGLTVVPGLRRDDGVRGS
jgi:hypothetical protein